MSEPRSHYEAALDLFYGVNPAFAELQRAAEQDLAMLSINAPRSNVIVFPRRPLADAPDHR
jgi:hypothetical protein